MIPSIGRIVHYIVPELGGKERPAIIVRVWDLQPTQESLVQLQVFLDGDETGGNDGQSRMLWRTSIQQGLNINNYHSFEDCLENKK